MFKLKLTIQFVNGRNTPITNMLRHGPPQAPVNWPASFMMVPPSSFTPKAMAVQIPPQRTTVNEKVLQLIFSSFKEIFTKKATKKG